MASTSAAAQGGSCESCSIVSIAVLGHAHILPYLATMSKGLTILSDHEQRDEGEVLVRDEAAGCSIKVQDCIVVT